MSCSADETTWGLEDAERKRSMRSAYDTSSRHCPRQTGGGAARKRSVAVPCSNGADLCLMTDQPTRRLRLDTQAYLLLWAQSRQHTQALSAMANPVYFLMECMFVHYLISP